MGGDRGRPWRRGIARRQRKAPPVEECRRNSGGGATSKTLAGKPFPVAVEWLVRTGPSEIPRPAPMCFRAQNLCGRPPPEESSGYSGEPSRILRSGRVEDREPSPLERQRYGSTSGRNGELGQDGVHVVVHRAPRQVQPLGDLRAGQLFCDQRQN